MDDSLIYQKLNHRLTETVNIHTVTRHKMRDALLDLSRTCWVGAVEQITTIVLVFDLGMMSAHRT
jgi:hypothetical protein